MFDWDDLRIFLAAARAGSLTAAAPVLGIDAATVGRRVARLETALKATLFVRSAGGLVLTSAGSHLLETGLNAEAAMGAAARVGQPDAVGGTVRLSTAEGFGAAILAPALPALRARRPALRIELAANAGFLSPTTREVDLAVTLSAPASPRLEVEPLTDYQLALYAAPDYLERAGRPDAAADLGRFDLVGYIEDLIYAPELRYMDEAHPSLRPSLSSSSINAQQKIIAAGGGIGILPCFLAGDLVQVLPEIVLTRRFWIGALREVAATARVRAVRDWLRDIAQANRDRLLPFSSGG
ncbi:MAG: LysR family transcriptional regulator [Caulobacter sp.]|nr:LysR family transcriptional regulator [Caulobacter sp.]